jgi:hypothetical protein
MATLGSQNHRLLVLRERNAPLPNLDDAQLGLVSSRGGMHQNVTVVSQYDDEPRAAFCERVLSRIKQELRLDVVYRGVVVSIANCVDADEADERRRLVHSLAAMLALRPNGSLVFVAPATAAAGLRAELLELAESAARGAPHLNVKVTFSEVKLAKLRSKASWVSALGADR